MKWKVANILKQVSLGWEPVTILIKVMREKYGNSWYTSQKFKLSKLVFYSKSVMNLQWGKLFFLHQVSVFPSMKWDNFLE